MEFELRVKWQRITDRHSKFYEMILAETVTTIKNLQDVGHKSWQNWSLNYVTWE